MKYFNNTGPHFNPRNANHGGPDSQVRHVGDLGNLQTDASGNAKGTIEDKYIKLIGPESVLGRMVVVHAGTDDLGQGGNEESLKTGNAGGRAACGVIGVCLPLLLFLYHGNCDHILILDCHKGLNLSAGYSAVFPFYPKGSLLDVCSRKNIAHLKYTNFLN